MSARRPLRAAAIPRPPPQAHTQARPPAQGGKGGKPPRFVAKAAAGSGSAKDAARAEHLAKVRGAPMATGGATTGSAISRLANKPLLPPAEPAPRSKGVRTE